MRSSVQCEQEKERLQDGSGENEKVGRVQVQGDKNRGLKRKRMAGRVLKEKSAGRRSSVQSSTRGTFYLSGSGVMKTRGCFVKRLGKKEGDQT